MKKEELLLVLLYLSGDKGLTPVQLQKSLFLAQQEFPELLQEKYSFTPYNYGPFDRTIYVDVDRLVRQGLARKKIRTGRSWASYAIDESAIECAKSRFNREGKRFQTYSSRLILWIQTHSFEQILASVYKKYPEYKANSIFKDKLK